MVLSLNTSLKGKILLQNIKHSPPPTLYKLHFEKEHKKSVKAPALTLFYILSTLNEPDQACYQYVQ